MAVVKGKSHWAKLDRAVNAFDPSKPRWSIDLQLDKEGIKQMKELGIPVKNKDDDRGDFVTFQKDQFLSRAFTLFQIRDCNWF